MLEVLEILELGRKKYDDTFKIQKALVQQRIKDQIPDTLIFVEHEPVLTIGRAGDEENILVPPGFLAEEGIAVFHVDRGGDITYHGPGQIVGYPIFKLTQNEKDLHWFMRSMEEVFIRFLADYGIKASRKEGLTGVWVGNEKITAMGIGVKRWVTYHGFAFNYNPNLDHFQLINPCGITDKGVTSLEMLIAQRPGVREIKEKIGKHFAEVFRRELRRVSCKARGLA